MPSTRLQLQLNAPPAAVYRALVDADLVRQWMVPDDMTMQVHEFEPVEGGRIRISVTYDLPTAAGKTHANTDTYSGRFARLVPGELVQQKLAFETANPQLQGEMTVTYTLAPCGMGTLLTAEHLDLPPALSTEENEIGWKVSLGKLAVLVETASASAPRLIG